MGDEPTGSTELSAALKDANRELIGTVVSTTDLVFAEQAAARFDLLWIDLEHSALSLRDTQALVIAASSGGAWSLVRLPTAATDGLGRILDTGADGVVVPRVEGPDELEAIARALHFPPAGLRGFAPRRSSLSLGSGPDPDRRPACIVQVESAQAVAAAGELAAAGVCDALVVGTADLSLDLGIPLGAKDPRLDAAVASVREAALGAGKGWGVAIGASPARMRELAGADGGCLIYGSDIRIFSEAMDGLMRSLTGPDPEQR